MQSIFRFICLIFLFTSPMLFAQIKVAVASNFTQTLKEIAHLYEIKTGEQILISSASTGTLYNQIMQGAPFDLFLSADSDRAVKIENSRFAVSGSVFTYARGQLAFWYPHNETVNQTDLMNLKDRLAIANPKLAPYGLAAKQVLSNLQLWDRISVVKGSNIAQAYQFIDSGSVKAGLVAYSLLLQNKQSHFYLLSVDLYQPILQQGVLLNSKNINQTQQFINFLQSSSMQQLIQSKGYL